MKNNMKEELTIEQKIEFINDVNEFNGTEKRFWIGDNDVYFVCYNATSIMDEIEEVDEDRINREYEKILAGM